MGFYDTTGYRPDATLAKQMAGGGIGSLFSKAGAGFNSLYQDAEKKRKLNADITNQIGTLKVSQRNAQTSERLADIQNRNANRSDNIYNDGVAKEAKTNNDSYSTTRAFLDQYMPKAGIPDVQSYNGYDKTTQSTILGQMNTLQEKIKAEQEAKLLKDKRAFELMKTAAGKTPDKPSYTTVTETDGMGKTTEFLLNKDNPTVKIPIGISYDKFDPKDRINEVEARNVTKNIEENNEAFGGYIPFANTYRKLNPFPYQTDLDARLYEMKQDPKYKGIQESVLYKQAVNELGGEIGISGAVSLTDKEKTSNYIKNRLNNGQNVSPQTLVGLGLAKDINEAKAIINYKHDIYSKNKKIADYTKSFVDANGLDDSGVNRAWQGIKQNGVGVFATLEKIANKIDPHRAKQASANDMQNMYKDLEANSQNWTMANQQLDVSRMIGDIATYLVPTLGVEASVAKTISGTIVKNAIKFGSLEAGMTKTFNRPNNEVFSNAMYGAGGAAGVAGAVKAGAGTSKYIRELGSKLNK